MGNNFCCPSGKILGYDVDYIIAYPTQKTVLIKDRLLGILHLIFTLSILIYIGVITVWYEQGYKEFIEPTATINNSIRQPNDTSSIDDLNYCVNANHPEPVYGEVLDCRMVPDEQIAMVLANQYLIMTRMNRSLVEYDASGYKDAQSAESPIDTIFTQDLEKYTIKIDHQWQVAKFRDKNADLKGNGDFAGTNYAMRGKLLNKKGDTVKEFHKGYDIFSIEDLLKAADIELSQGNDAAVIDSRETLRYTGAIILFTINYLQTRDGIVSYEYTAVHVVGSEYKNTNVVSYNETHDVRENRHSINIIFVPAGEIGRFNMQNLMLAVVASFSLLLVANTITEYLMIYLLPLREKYGSAKYEYTIDYSDYRKEHKLDFWGVRSMKSCFNTVFFCCPIEYRFSVDETTNSHDITRTPSIQC